ncbi:MAG: type IV toxin-antitoxin system AbiEi family antitoxin [Candidatus Aminicenantaceae bacterium]
MIIESKEKKILNDALGEFRKNTGLVVDVVEFEDRALNVVYYHDAIVKIQWNDLDNYFAVEIKNIVTRAILGVAVKQLNLFQQKGMLVAKYINPRIADELKKMDVPFIDTVGNAYINEPPLFIYIKGNKPTDKDILEQPARTFRPKGLQVIFALLCNPGLENKPFREIAIKADVALGTVGWVMYDLRRMDYLIDVGPRNRRLVRKDNLLDRWVAAYPEQLRPKKMIGRFKADNPNWWENTDLKEINALWGGEVAANIMIEYLRPQIITVYAKQPIGRFLLKNRLKNDVNGDIEILKIFWKFEQDRLHNDLVPPLLIYADLMATGDTRNIETARMIYEKELSKYFRED